MSDRQDKGTKVPLQLDTVLPIVEAFCQQDVIRYHAELLRQYVQVRLFNQRHNNTFPWQSSTSGRYPTAKPVATVSKLTLHQWAKDYDREYNKRRERLH